MIFAIHQPNYIPWSGYFYKIYCADIFVYLDSVQYPRGQSIAARNQIKTPNGKSFLTIPVSIPKGNDGKVTYMDVQYAEANWRAKHLKILEANYKKAPYYHEVLPLVASVFSLELDFVNNNIRITENICNYLEIPSERIRLSEMGNNFGNKTELIMDIGQKVQADIYLSGDGGGKEYTDETVLTENNIKLLFTQYKQPVYKQLWNETFESYLSILDLLFNEGKNSLELILKNNSGQQAT